MNKIFKYLCLGTLAAFAIISVSSCKDDKGEPELTTPKYEEDAALYDIQDPNSPISSIELTASGNYVITENPYRNYAKRNGKNFFSLLKDRTRYDEFDGIIYGTYTKNSDGSYNLKGWGTLVIYEEGDNAVSMDVILTNGEQMNFLAERQPQYGDSSMTNKLCRTWNLKKIKGIFKENGKVVESAEMTLQQYINMVGEDERVPRQVTFTKAGTYIVYYTNSTLAVSTWRWEDEERGVLRYSWDYDNIYGGSTIDVSFSNNQLVITESWEYDNEEEIMIYYLSQA